MGGGTDVAVEVTTISVEERDAFTSEWFDPLASPSLGADGVIELDVWDDLLRRASPEVAHVTVGGESWTSPVDAATWTGSTEVISVSCQATTSRRDAATSVRANISIDAATSTPYRSTVSLAKPVTRNISK